MVPVYMHMMFYLHNGFFFFYIVQVTNLLKFLKNSRTHYFQTEPETGCSFSKELNLGWRYNRIH